MSTTPNRTLAESMLGTPYHAVAMNTIANQQREQGERDIEDRLDASAADIIADARTAAAADRRKLAAFPAMREALRDLRAWFAANPDPGALSAGEHLFAGCPNHLRASLGKADAALAAAEGGKE